MRRVDRAKPVPDRQLKLTLLTLAIAAFGTRIAVGTPGPALEPGPEALASVSGELNVLIVTIDTLRADRLGSYGYDEARTPVLDALAASGVRFDNVYSHQPVTLPSHATLFTGTHTAYHGVEDNGLFTLPEEAVTMAETLKAEGLTTGAVIAAFVLHRQYGLAQGFDTYDDSLSAGRKKNAGGYEEITATAVSDRALEWIGQNGDERWFLWLHYYDPHGDYEPPPEYRAPGLSPYDGEIAYVDHELGRVMDALEHRDLLERTLVVVTSDHGESLGEHGELAHGLFLYDATMRVPLIVSLPGALPAGRVVDETVSLVDLAPTVLSLVDVDVPSQTQGQSLVPLLLSDAEDFEEEPVLLETMAPWRQYGWSPSRAIVSENYKLIDAPTPELYDLAADPSELDNVIEDHRPLARSMFKQYQELRAKHAEGSLENRGRATLDDEARDRLESLGYVFAGPDSDDPDDDAPDVKDMIEVTRAIKLASELRASGREREAFSVLEEVLEQSPETRVVLNRLGTWYALKKEFDTAEKYFKRLLEIDPEYVETYRNLGLLYANANRLDEAAEMAEIVLSKFPRSAKAYGLLGIVRLKKKDYRGALEPLNKAIEYYPGDHEAFVNRSVAYFRLGQYEKALDDLKAAHRIVPDNERYAQFVEQLERQLKTR